MAGAPHDRVDPLGRRLAQVVGARLRARREAKRLTLMALAARAGVATGTISRMERGLMLGTLACHLRLARVLQLPLASLFRGIEPRLRS